MSDERRDGPRLARADELPDIHSLVDRCFNCVSGEMRAINPLCYDESHPERHAIIRRDGDIVSHVACVPETWVVGGDRLRCWGVSGVATDPRHRGNGYMSELIKFWLDRMDDANIPISQLWGDRQRYGRFGWAIGGRECEYDINRRSYPDPPDRDEHIVHYDGSDEHLAHLDAVHRTTRYHVERDRAVHQNVFGQRGVETFLYVEPDKAAYLSFSNDGRTRIVKELGGSDRGVQALLSYLLRAYYTEQIRCYVHPTDDLNETLAAVSSDWRVHTLKKLNVRDLPVVLDAFSEQMSGRWRTSAHSSDGELTLAIRDSADAATISWMDDQVGVTRTDTEPNLTLNRREMTRFLFDASEHTGRTETPSPFLRAVLPLDFYIWRTEYV